MEGIHVFWIAVCLVLSLLAAASPFVLWWLRRNDGGAEKGRRLSGKLTLLIALLIAVYFLRYALQYCHVLYPAPGLEPSSLSVTEELVNNVHKTLRILMLEEDYSELYLSTVNLFDRLGAAGVPWAFMGVPTLIYATLLHFSTPLVGGAIVLDALASVFPGLLLRWRLLRYRKKEKIYFSELNEASLALAKSLREESRRSKKPLPVIVFTDAYVDDEKEKDYELFLEAKHSGAICIRDDLAHAPKPQNGTGNYYLMDEREFGNLNTLMELTEKKNLPFVKKSKIYLFVQTDAYVRFEKAVREKLISGGGLKEEFPLIVPVNAYRNLAQNLLTDVPLYEPLLRREDRSRLTVTIFGNGGIGTETFLAVYWFGQMLAGTGEDDLCEVTVNVVSKDAPEAFWSKLDYINPEIGRTCCVIPGRKGEKTLPSLLRCCGKENPSYCTVRYQQADVKIDGFWEGLSKEDGILRETDYFVVSLGSDGDNVAVAEKLRLFVGEARLREKALKDTVIAYAVFHSALCHGLNQEREKEGTELLGSQIDCYAFGALDQVYSCENVLMSKDSVWAEEMGNAYRRQKNREVGESAHRQRRQDEDRNYSYWADLARAMHVKYKVFSLGWIHSSPYKPCLEAGVSRRKKYRMEVEALCSAYRRSIVAASILRQSKEGEFAIDESDRLRLRELEEKKEILAWLEHRRWCAFTRTMGYRSTELLEENLKATGKHKNMPLKLHPCLVEAQMPQGGAPYKRIPPLIAEKKDETDEEAALRLRAKKCHEEYVTKVCAGIIKADPLDRLSCRWTELLGRKKFTEFKEYDSWQHEFEDYVKQSDFDRWNREDGAEKVPFLGSERLEALLSREGEEIGAFRYPEGEGTTVWLIPKSYILSQIEKRCQKFEPGEAEEARAKKGEYENCFCYEKVWFLCPGEKTLREKKAKSKG